MFSQVLDKQRSSKNVVRKEVKQVVWLQEFLALAQGTAHGNPGKVLAQGIL